MTADLQRHPLSAAFGDMPKDEFDQLVADIKKNGLVQAVVTIRDEHGTDFVLDGWHRYRACMAAGVKPRSEPFDYVVEPAGEQAGRTMTPAEFVVAANAHRRHLTREQRRQIIVELLKAKPEASDRVIATQAKVDHKTVGAVRKQAEATGEAPQLSKTTGKDGKSRAKPAPAAKYKPQPMSKAAYEVGMRAAPVAPGGQVRVSYFDLTRWTMATGAILEACEPFAASREDLPEFVGIPLDSLQGIADRMGDTTLQMTRAIEDAQGQADEQEAA